LVTIQIRRRPFTWIKLFGSQDDIVVDAEACIAGSALDHTIHQVATYGKTLPTGWATDTEGLCCLWRVGHVM
jgi:hypothetical protein